MLKTLLRTGSALVAASEYFMSAGVETVAAAGVRPFDDTWTSGRTRGDLK